MKLRPDSKPDRGSDGPQVVNNPLQPTTSNISKAAEAAAERQHQSIMATIADDDDRLLVRIGYTPVHPLFRLFEPITDKS